MTLNMNLLLLVGIVAFFTQTANSHYCYSCNTAIGDGNGIDHCADPFNPFGMEGSIKKYCTLGSVNTNSQSLDLDIVVANSSGCMKRIIKSGGVKIYTRDCYIGDINNKKYDQYFMTADAKLIEFNICDEFLCNGSNEVTATMSFGLFLAILLIRKLF